jgi:hypothetical protein
MPDGTENQKDASAVTQDTSKGNQETPQDRTYTEAEVRKVVNDRLAQAGREAKAIEQAKVELEKKEQELVQWRRHKDEAEYEAVRGDPDALSQYQKEKAIQKREDELVKRELKHQVEIERVREYAKEKETSDIAQKYGIDADMLNDLDLPSDKLEKVAAKMVNQELADTGKKATTSRVKRDSGMTIGGRTSFSREQIKDHEFFKANKEAILEAQRLGRISD